MASGGRWRPAAGHGNLCSWPGLVRWRDQPGGTLAHSDDSNRVAYNAGDAIANDASHSDFHPGTHGHPNAHVAADQHAHSYRHLDTDANAHPPAYANSHRDASAYSTTAAYQATETEADDGTSVG